MITEYVSMNLLVLQALFWGKMNGGDIRRWLASKEQLRKPSRSQISKTLKWLRVRGLVELEFSNKGEVELIKDRLDIYKITDRGRAELRAIREGIKVIFSEPPKHLQIHI